MREQFKLKSFLTAPLPHERRPRRNAEQQIQRAVFQHIHQRGAPGVFAFHPMNGGIHQSGGRRAAINAMMGVKAGVPDVCILYKGAFYGLELKAENGRATDKQLQAVDNIRNAGGFACICYGLDRALATLKTWGIIR